MAREYGPKLSRRRSNAPSDEGGISLASAFMMRPPPTTTASGIEELPEPIRSIALAVIEDLVDSGYSRRRATRHAELLAAAFVAERLWDASPVVVSYTRVETTFADGP
jgi:hypothetical protein